MQNVIVKEKVCFFKKTSLLKLFLLSLLSYGFYDIILAYSYWKSLKQAYNYKISPFWRGFFVNLTNFKLFQLINKYLVVNGNKSIRPILLASIYLFCYIASNYINNHLNKSHLLDLIFLDFLIRLIPTIILCSIQKKINSSYGQDYPKSFENKWNILNILYVIIFMFFFSFHIIGYNISKSKLDKAYVSIDIIDISKIIETQQQGFKPELTSVGLANYVAKAIKDVEYTQKGNSLFFEDNHVWTFVVKDSCQKENECYVKIDFLDYFNKKRNTRLPMYINQKQEVYFKTSDIENLTGVQF